MLGRALVAVRNQLVQITTELSNQIRGLMKTFGLLVPAGKGSKFEEHVRGLLTDQAELARIILPVLEGGGPCACARQSLDGSSSPAPAGARHARSSCRCQASVP